MGMDENLKASLGIDIDNLDGDHNFETDEIKVIRRFVLKEVKSRLSNLEEKHDLETDYLYVRSILHTLLDKTGDALENMYHLALDSEQPMAYGKFTELANTMRSLTGDLIGLQKTVKEVKRNNPDFPINLVEEVQTEDDNNRKFIGTLNDILNQKTDTSI